MSQTAAEKDGKTDLSIAIGIVGAGLAGSMMSSLLSKLGYKVFLFEKRKPEV